MLTRQLCLELIKYASFYLSCYISELAATNRKLCSDRKLLTVIQLDNLRQPVSADELI